MTLILDKSLHSKLATLIAYMADDNIIREDVSDSNFVFSPVFIPFRNENTFIVRGLCNVARRIVKQSIQLEEEEDIKKEKELLLGYKSNCLKGCAAVSKWTKFCEVDFPMATERLTQAIRNGDSALLIPEEYIQLEKEFSAPKKIANSRRYQFEKDTSSTDKAENNANYSIKLLREIKVMNPIQCDSNLHTNQISMLSNNAIYERKNSDILWPYLCGIELTIADLLVLGTIVELLCSMPCLCVVKGFFISLPNICKWFLQCTSKPGLSNALAKIWIGCNDQFCVNLRIPTFSFDNTLSIHHVSFAEKKLNTKQMHSRITKHLPSIVDKLSNEGVMPIFSQVNLIPIPWNDMPVEVNPTEGELNPSRALRKCQQIENIVSLLLPVIKNGDKIVDFCAGGGHLGIVIAFLRPDCHVTLIENKEESIDRALDRIRKLCLTNVSLNLSNLEYFGEKFDIGVALHACGSATDLVLKKCIASSASFVICPCCYGSIRSSDSISYPRSMKFSFIKEADYLILGHSADQTSVNYETDYSKQGKRSMLYVDYDRISHAEEMCHYKTNIYSMVPISCSPKNNIIVGVRDGFENR